MHSRARDTVFDRVIAWFRRHVFVTDCLWAALWTLVAMAGVNASTMGWLAVITIATGLVLTVRRRYPRTVILMLAGLMVIHILVLDVLSVTAVVATCAAAYIAYATLPRRDVVLTTCALLAGTYWAAQEYAPDLLPSDETNRWPLVVTQWIFLALFCLLGLLARVRRRDLRRMVEGVELAARQREGELRLAALAQRTHIAREMHDIIAHSLGVIIAQADGGRYAASHDAAAPIGSLEIISKVSRDSLAEMRQLLTVLRNDDARELLPAPALTDLGELAEDYHKAGVHVRLTSTGEEPDLPEAIALTVYRVVQESLANALKHAGRTSVEVRLAWAPDHLTITARNPMPDPVPPVNPGGHGLIGMRERVALHNGSLRTGIEDDMWLVRAEIPTPSRGSTS